MAAVGKGQAGSMKKTAGGGYFLIPAGPALGTAVVSGGVDTYGSWAEMIASTSAALYVVGVSVDSGGNNTTDYIQISIGTGAAASESSVSEWKYEIGSVTGMNDARVITFPFPIPVATATRIACRVASQDSAPHAVTLICINQSDLADL